MVVCQAPLSMGFPRQECYSGLPFPSPGHLPHPEIKHAFPALWVDSLPLSHQTYKVLAAPLAEQSFTYYPIL